MRYLQEWETNVVQKVRKTESNVDLTIVKFYDYQCPFCKEMQTELAQLEKYYAGTVEILHIHYPLPTHEYALEAAIAAECAREQGFFEAYHGLLFEQQQHLENREWEAIAFRAGIPGVAEFLLCLEEEQTIDTINTGMAISDELQITRIPTTIANGWVVEGVVPYYWLQRLAELPAP
ncbi:MAG: DsbA family protein [Balneolaceae bacterium]